MSLYATCCFFVNVLEINLCGHMCLIYLLPCKILGRNFFLSSNYGQLDDFQFVWLSQTLCNELSWVSLYMLARASLSYSSKGKVQLEIANLLSEVAIYICIHTTPCDFSFPHLLFNTWHYLRLKKKTSKSPPYPYLWPPSRMIFLNIRTGKNKAIYFKC